MNLETIIGLEIHIELKTDTKIFSSSPSHFGAEPNENTNAYDWAHPGVLPRLNKKAVDYGLRASLALNMDIHQDSWFDRKNYYYPDMPLGYQISQMPYPIGHDGYVDIEVDGKTKRINIERLHLETDAGKNTHGNNNDSYADLNRAGTSLIEIVSEPDIRSPQEAYAYLDKVRETILYSGVSDVKMQEGSLRCDANISLRPYGQEEFNPKSEIKNLNSLNYIQKALEYEVKRQEKIYMAGGIVEGGTLRYHPDSNTTELMRVKGEDADYRIIPDVDIAPFHISDEWVEEARKALPEMPDVLRKRYVEEFGLSEYDAGVLTANRNISDFFDETIELGADPKQAANWLMGDVSAHLNETQEDILDTPFTPQHLADMVALVEDGTISSKIAKKLFTELMAEGGSAEEVVEKNGWKQLSDPAELIEIINGILDENEQSIEDFKGGKDRALGFLVGQTMKATRGQANPEMVNKILLEEINKR